MSAISLTNLPLSTNSSTAASYLKNYFKERRAEVKQLGEALQSGDLAAAQQDYNKIVSLGKKVLDRNNPYFRADRGQDFNAIGGALQNGDRAGAQRAFAALESTYRLPPASSSSGAPVVSAPGSQSGVNVVA
jgi:hypothetical protein